MEHTALRQPLLMCDSCWQYRFESFFLYVVTNWKDIFVYFLALSTAVRFAGYAIDSVFFYSFLSIEYRLLNHKWTTAWYKLVKFCLKKQTAHSAMYTFYICWTSTVKVSQVEATISQCNPMLRRTHTCIRNKTLHENTFFTHSFGTLMSFNRSRMEWNTV